MYNLTLLSHFIQMSITTLKRKTDGSYHVSGGLHGKGYVNAISSGRRAFSLNDPRRVSAQTGKTSIQTRMRGTGYRGHGGNYGSFPINPVRSSYQNNYDPFDVARVSRPKPVPQCIVVQQMTPLDHETHAELIKGAEIKKEICENAPNKSGSCVTRTSKVRTYGTFVQKEPITYAQYMQRKHAPLPNGKEHYPPMVSRNSTFTSVPNFSFADFIQRLTCK
jgi:hypothetical protein